jgi:hypothetical protein
MSGSGARRYLAVEQTQEHLMGSSAAAILSNLRDQFLGEAGVLDDDYSPERRPVAPSNERMDIDDTPQNAVPQELIAAQLGRMGMRGQTFGGLLEPVSNVIPFPGAQGQPMGAPQMPIGENLAQTIDPAQLAEMGMRGPPPR